jgi:hypothetical protein
MGAIQEKIEDQALGKTWVDGGNERRFSPGIEIRGFTGLTEGGKN